MNIWVFFEIPRIGMYTRGSSVFLRDAHLTFENVKFDTLREKWVRVTTEPQIPVLLFHTWLTSLLIFWRNHTAFLLVQDQRQCTESSVKTECEYRMLDKYPTAKIIFPLSFSLSLSFFLFFFFSFLLPFSLYFSMVADSFIAFLAREKLQVGKIAVSREESWLY